MSANILYGKDFAAQIKAAAKAEVDTLKNNFNVTPALAVVIVGEDPASQVYVRNKHKTCEELGIKSEVVALPDSTTKAELLAKIDELNADKSIHGILVQLPLPAAIKAHSDEILNRIDPLKDVDGFHPMNVGKLVTGTPALIPCTPAGCIEMLDLAGIPIDGKRAVIIGRSNIVGKPMAQLLLQRSATVTIAHSRTADLSAVVRRADIVVAAVGRPRMITADYLKEGAAVIDVGINSAPDGSIHGDVVFDEVAPRASFITPVPGGVGPMTIACLLENTLGLCTKK